MGQQSEVRSQEDALELKVREYIKAVYAEFEDPIARQKVAEVLGKHKESFLAELSDM